MATLPQRWTCFTQPGVFGCGEDITLQINLETLNRSLQFDGVGEGGHAIASAAVDRTGWETFNKLDAQKDATD